MMNRLTKATYVYWLLVMINFVSVMFNVSLYLLITSYISKKNLIPLTTITGHTW
jgi:hypothetical protein